MSAIDNLIKGQAGQAIQSLNIMAGIPEEIAKHALTLAASKMPMGTRIVSRTNVRSRD